MRLYMIYKTIYEYYYILYIYLCWLFSVLRIITKYDNAVKPVYTEPSWDLLVCLE